MPITTPTFPGTMTANDLLISALAAKLEIDEVFYGVGKYTAEEITSKYASKAAISTELSTYTKPLGECSESSVKTDSKVNKLKTRNYQIPGKRTSTVELTIVGISTAQKDYLEGAGFSGEEITIIALNKAHTSGVIFNGLRWSVEWSGASDGLWTVTISSEISGKSESIIPLIIKS